jgi:hypothetical protein
LTDLIIDLLRLNGLLVTAGDRMVAGLGLTSTRWQVLGRPSASAVGERPFRGLAIKNIDTTRRVVAELRKKLELTGERAST